MKYTKIILQNIINKKRKITEDISKKIYFYEKNFKAVDYIENNNEYFIIINDIREDIHYCKLIRQFENNLKDLNHYDILLNNLNH